MTTSTLPAGTPTAPPARPTGPNAWLVIGGFVTAAVLVLGGISFAGWLGYRTEMQTASYATPDLSNITVDLDTGDLTVTVGQSDTVAVSRRLFWTYDKPTVDERWDGQALRVTGGCRHSWIGPGCGVDYTLAIPPGAAVRASTSTGDISVRSIAGRLELSTSTGNISVHGATGPLALHTDTGDITAADLTSDVVEASTSTGEVALRFAGSPTSVVVSTGTGDLTVVVPNEEDYRVHADTGTGDLDIQIRRNDSGGRAIDARTGTGDIHLRYA